MSANPTPEARHPWTPVAIPPPERRRVKCEYCEGSGRAIDYEDGEPEVSECNACIGRGTVPEGRQ